MHQNIDLIELLRELNAAGAKFLMVEAYALAFHGRPRATKDADIFIGYNPQNAKKVWKALVSFGAPLDALTPADLASPGMFYLMGRPPNQIDIITEIDGVTFEKAWSGRVASTMAMCPSTILASPISF